MSNMSCGIYKIRNIINNKVYIGQSKDIETRWINHKSSNDNYPIHRAIRKYGKENFVLEILCECDPSDLNKYEQMYIKKYDCIAPNGYNLTSGGGQCSYYSEESKMKMSKSAMGHKNHCVPHSDETKKIISEKSRGNTSHKGFHHSEETRMKMAERKRGKPGNRRGKTLERFKWMTPEGDIRYMTRGKALSLHPDWKEIIDNINDVDGISE